MDERFLYALGLTTLAGLSTGIGGAIAVFARRTHKGFLAVSLGFSAGVMLWVSFLELLPEAGDALTTEFGDGAGGVLTALAFFSGAVLTLFIDRAVPAVENPHEAVLVEDLGHDHHGHLHRLGVVTAIAVAVHNFPEGMATFFAALPDPARGLAIAIAVALHNIPEGISVSVPIYFATGSRKKAFWMSLLSGLSEPVGALLAWIVLHSWLTPGVAGMVDAAVAGVMVFVSLDQLVPNARRYDEGHGAVYGLIAGMAVMAATLQVI